MSRYRCVDAQKAAGFPVVAACDAAQVRRSTYYAWTASAAQGPPDRHREQARLVGEIHRIHARSKATYGAPRVTAELWRRGWKVNHKRVERLMRAHGIVGYRPRRRRSLTRQDRGAPPAPDLLGRLFDPDRPDVAWCGDVTYIPTDQGWLYLASVLDLASRHLLGYSMSAHHDAGLVCDALDAALATRGQQRMPDTIFHSDRGAEDPSATRAAPQRRRLPLRVTVGTADRTSGLEDEGVADGAFAGGVGGAAEELPVGDHSGGAAAVEVEGLAGAKGAHDGGLLREAQAYAVAGLASVGGDQQHVAAGGDPAMVRGFRRTPKP